MHAGSGCTCHHIRLDSMVNILGFGKTKVYYHYYKHVTGKKLWNFTVIGERTVPIEKCDYNYDAN